MAGKEAGAAALTAQKNETQTVEAKVRLVMHPRQAFASVVKLDGYEFKKGAEVEVPAADAERLLQRRDEQGQRYVKKA